MVYGDYHHVSSPANDMGGGGILMRRRLLGFIEEESREIQGNGDQRFWAAVQVVWDLEKNSASELFRL